MPTPTLVVVRHGQTDWNAEGRLQGRQDIPLNELGRRQASENGRTLRSWLTISGHDPNQYRWLASPLGRCRETAERIRDAIGIDQHDYETDDRLVEISFGDWEGRTSSELKDEAPDAWRERRDNKWGYVPPNGESYEVMTERIGGFVHEKLNGGIEPTILVVHGGVIRALHRLLLDVIETRVAELPIPQDRLLLIDRDRQRGVWL